jgi:hypothetical protein
VDVEGAVDMVGCGEERDRQITTVAINIDKY